MELAAVQAGGMVRVGLVATAARWKGHELFLRALTRLAHDGAPVPGPPGGGGVRGLPGQAAACGGRMARASPCSAGMVKTSPVLGCS